MTWREIQSLIHGPYEVAVAIDEHKNKYWLRIYGVHYPISSLQFERLLEQGYIDPEYRMERGTGLWGEDQMIYRGR